MSSSILDIALAEAVRLAIAPLELKIDALTGEIQGLRTGGGKPLDPNDYLVLPLAAKESGKHSDTLRRAIKAKKLKAAKADGSREWSIRRGDLIEWLSGGRSRGPSKSMDDKARIADAVERMARKAG